MQCHAEDIGHIVLLWLQDGQSRRTGGLDFSPDVTTLGLQALVRLYYSTLQCLGYVFPALPTSFQLENGCVVLPKGRIAPESHSSSISLELQMFSKAVSTRCMWSSKQVLTSLRR